VALQNITHKKLITNFKNAPKTLSEWEHKKKTTFNTKLIIE